MKYRRAVISRAGPPEVLELITEDLPTPGPDEALVRVHNAGVAYGDVLRRSGNLPGAPKIPYTCGYDLAGVVDSVGAEVSNLKAGDRVAAFLETGCYGEYVCAPSSLFVPLPDEMELEVAAAIPLNYITAHQMLHRAAHAKKGERVLIHGAAGGLGTAALQVAAMAKLQTFGTASASKHDLVRELGGVPIDYKSEDFVERIGQLTDDGVDIVLDPVGGSNWNRSFKTLRRKGRLVAFGMSAVISEGRWSAYAAFLRLGLFKLTPNGKSASFYGIAHTHGSSLQACATDLEHLMGAWKKGQIAPVIGARLPLDDVVKAHRLIESSAVSGKIVLECGG